MRESLEWLTSHFFRLRVSSADGYGLYPAWSPYAGHVGRLLGHLATEIITNSAQSFTRATSPSSDAELGEPVCYTVYLCLLCVIHFESSNNYHMSDATRLADETMMHVMMECTAL